jgi:hypothetical protein
MKNAFLFILGTIGISMAALWLLLVLGSLFGA